jgi:antitoxin component of MazEF toxin-antitoxin module
MAYKKRTSIQEHGNGKAIYLPADIISDSGFPFTEKDYSDLVIEIRGKELVVRIRSKDELNS